MRGRGHKQHDLRGGRSSGGGMSPSKPVLSGQEKLRLQEWERFIHPGAESALIRVAAAAVAAAAAWQTAMLAGPRSAARLLRANRSLLTPTRTRTFPTVSVVKELGDVEGAAGGPGRRPVEAEQHGRHQVAAPQGPEQPLAGLGVVVGHAQHVS